ncbi:MAG: hypothetical protein JSV65_14995 [Armatimonadota bacterium]|nr:MAG: hypothetical protein JSV65_14995 [Armatimonadota bacterium]
MLLTTALIVGGLLAVAAVLFAATRLADDRRLAVIWRSLEVEGAGETFSADMVAGLPEPGRRYFLHAIRPGTPLAASVRLEMTGAIKPGPKAAWMPLEAEQIVAPPKGFVWKASVKGGAMSLSGADYYANGEGRQGFRLWGLIPLISAEGADTAKSAAGRCAAEALLVPSALLPQRGAKWEAVDEKSAKVVMEIDGELVTLTISVEPDGKLRDMSLPRWGNQTEDGSYDYIPFGMECLEERRFGGYAIPSEIRAGWWYGTKRYSEFFRATIAKAEFR